MQRNSPGQRQPYQDRFGYILALFLVIAIVLNKYHPISLDDETFANSFITWFGVLYGVFLQMALVRAWEQFQAIERGFDKELNAIMILFQNTILIEGHTAFKIEFLSLLARYLDHVRRHCPFEAEDARLKQTGNDMLWELRTRYAGLLRQLPEASRAQPFVGDLLVQLNMVVNARRDRLAHCSKRLFSILKFVSKMISVVWLIPFYYANIHLGAYGYGLIGLVTFLVLAIITLIENLDRPFSGLWSINLKPWEEFRAQVNERVSGLNVNDPTEPPAQPLVVTGLGHLVSILQLIFGDRPAR